MSHSITSSYKQTIVYGFALFAMFFGSGNLVFPLQAGQLTGSNWLAAFFGLFVTGIVLPFLGLFVIKLHRGNYNSFFGEAGSIAQWVLPLFTLSLLGSFGVVPRCITVAYASISPLFPQFSLFWFSILFSALCYSICFKDRMIIQILGKWMSPLLVLSLVWMIFKGIINAPDAALMKSSECNAFSTGFLIGYQIMDLFAAFFFSSFIFLQIQKSMPQTAKTKDILKAALAPSFLGVTLLAMIYMGLVFLGAQYASMIQHVSPELILPTIALHMLGNNGTLLIAIAISFSCLTTAVALNNIYARYLCTLFKLDTKSFPIVLLCTTLISFCVSLLDFRGIAAFLAPALELTYPSIIVLTMLCICTSGHKKLKMISFYAVLFLMIYMRYIQN